MGRRDEIALVRSALVADEPPFAVLLVHGPGGVGKTALLGALTELAVSVGVRPVLVDMRTIEPTPAAFLDRFHAILGQGTAGGADASTGGLASVGRLMVLVDTLELAAPIDSWLREHFVASLPSDALVVVASRTPPSRGWLTDPGWRDLLWVVPLRNLSPTEVRSYLGLQGVDGTLHDQLIALTHGHPLALSLVVDVLDQRSRTQGAGAAGAVGGPPADRQGGAIDLVDAPDVVRMLMERFIDEIPDARHRHALAVCAHARCTTEDLLRAAMGGDDASELLAWLRSRSFVEESRDGVFPHDLARDVLDTDLRWRDRVAYEDLHRRVRAHIVHRVRTSTGLAQQRAAADLLYLRRLNPVMPSMVDMTQLEHVYAAAVADHEQDLVVQMIERHQGPAQGALVRHWLARQRDAFVVFRRQHDLVGCGAWLRLDEASADDIAADPGAHAMWAYATRHHPPRPGEAVTAVRFFVDRDANQSPRSPSWTAFGLTQVPYSFGTPRPAWHFIGALQSLDMQSLFDQIDYQRVPEAEFDVGGRHHVVFARDWRRLGLDAFLELMGHRDLDDRDEGPGTRVPGPERSTPRLVLTEPEFGAAVRTALRDRHRPDRLAVNPLVRSQALWRRFGADAGVEQLARLLDETAETLASDPRDRKAQQAIDRTYLRPAGTQERAAELLGLPFSTYRRHLTRGVQRIVDLLWVLELDGH